MLKAEQHNRPISRVAARFAQQIVPGYIERMIIMREVLSSDQPLLNEMLYHSLYVPPDHEPFSRDILQNPDVNKYVAGWGRPGDLAFIAFDSATGNSLGAAWLRLLKGDERGYGYVDDDTPELGVAVLDFYRGQGVGTALLERLLEAAAARYRSVSLSVSEGNPAAKLYERLGFKLVGGEGTSLTMLKELQVKL